MSEERDRAAAAIARSDQRQASLSDMADDLSVFYWRLREYNEMDDFDAFELTRTLLVESVANE